MVCGWILDQAIPEFTRSRGLGGEESTAINGNYVQQQQTKLGEQLNYNEQTRTNQPNRFLSAVFPSPPAPSPQKSGVSLILKA
jgi:hypothetical protein